MDEVRDMLTGGPPTTVHFEGGPWDGSTADVPSVDDPEFEEGHRIGAHYLLDTEHEPPTYRWDGTEVVT